MMLRQPNVFVVDLKGITCSGLFKWRDTATGACYLKDLKNGVVSCDVAVTLNLEINLEERFPMKNFNKKPDFVQCLLLKK